MHPAIAVWNWNALSGLDEIWTAFPRALPWAKVEPPLRGLRCKRRRSERQRHDLVRGVSQIARAVPRATAKHTGQSRSINNQQTLSFKRRLPTSTTKHHLPPPGTTEHQCRSSEFPVLRRKFPVFRGTGNSRLTS